MMIYAKLRKHDEILQYGTFDVQDKTMIYMYIT